MVDTAGHLGCYLHVQLTLSGNIYIFCMQRFDSGACIRNILQPEALNAKETFHAHQVSTHTLCISSKGIASKVHSRSAKLSCAELCEY